MSFMDMVAKAKVSGQYDSDFFNPNLKGQVEVERLFMRNGFKGTSVILEARVVSCEPTKADAKPHLPGAKVKKIYSITKFGEVAAGQLKTDIFNIMGLDPESVSDKDVKGLLSEIFEDSTSPGYELRGYITDFVTKVIDRSEKKKEDITAVYFRHVPNDEKELAARKAAIDARVK